MKTSTLVLLGLSLIVCGNIAVAQESGPLIMAHRGGSHEFEESTLAAFRACYDKGIRGFETDVRMTKDNVLVVLHDEKLERTYNATGVVESLTSDELKQLVSKKGEPFLFLDELLAYFEDKPGVYLELEMKVGNTALYPDERLAEYCRKLHEAAEAKRPTSSIYAYTSFDERPLRLIRSMDEPAPTLLIAGKPLTAEFIERARNLQVNYIGCQLSGTSRTMVKEAQKQGFKVNCWPGHTIQDYFLCLGLGVNVHCTDIPLAILAVEEKLR